MKRFNKFYQSIFVSIFFSNLYSFSFTEYVTNLFTPNEKENLSKEYAFDENGMLEITIPKGNITINTWKNKKLLIDVSKQGSKESLKATTLSANIASAMGRLFVKINDPKEAATINLKIMAPENIKLKIVNSETGSIIIKNVYGSINAQTKSGNIEIKNAYSKVNAKTNTGKIILKQKQFTSEDSIFLETLSGEVQLYLPKHINADFQAKTSKGVITSQVSITLCALTTKLNKEFWNQIKKEVVGTIGEGGAPITIDSGRGNISVYEN